MDLKWNLTFALCCYWNTGADFWRGELESEIAWAEHHIGQPLFEGSNITHPLED